MKKDAAIQKIAEDLQITLTSNDHDDILLIIDRINELIQKDFPLLLSVLYRIDVSEERLKSVLNSQPETDAAILITQLILERQKEKLKSKEINKNFGDIPEDEKW
jgi:hypothetical protein